MAPFNPMMDDEVKSGYWGPVTSRADFCEENYAVTLYVAEFCKLYFVRVKTKRAKFPLVLSEITEWFSSLIERSFISSLSEVTL